MARRRAIRELEELPAEFLQAPLDISSRTAIRDFFLAHSMRCLAAQGHDQAAAAVRGAG
jgi:hypothetical protein